MSFIKSESIFDTIRPVSCLSRIFGIFPFTITKNKQKFDISTKFTDLLFVVIQLSLITFFIAMNLISNVFVDSNASEITNIGMHAIITAALILIFLIVFVNFLFKKNIAKMLVSLNEIDEAMQDINIEEDFSGATIKRLWFLIADSIYCFSTLGAVVYLFMYELNTPPNYRIICSLSLLVITYSVFFVNYLLFVHCVWVRFICLNKCLETFIGKKDTNKLNLNITKFAMIHDKLNDIVGYINFHYSLWILFSTGCCFVFTVLNVFSAIRVFFNYEYYSFILTTIYMILTFYYLCRTVYVIAFGSNTTLEVSFHFLI